MSSRSAASEIRDHLLCGGFGAVFFVVMLLVLDVATLGTLLRAEPQLLPVYFIGGVLAFAPLILCVAIGRLARGEQRS